MLAETGSRSLETLQVTHYAHSKPQTPMLAKHGFGNRTTRNGEVKIGGPELEVRGYIK